LFQSLSIESRRAENPKRKTDHHQETEEFKNGFAADRLSCHRFRANVFRLLLHSFAYNLVNPFRLQLPSSLRSAQIETLRIQLFKIGARIRETARCIRIHLASGRPFQHLFQATSLCNSS